MQKMKFFGFLMATLVALSLTITDPAAYAKDNERRSVSRGSNAFKGSGRPTYMARDSSPAPSKFIGGGRPASAPQQTPKNAFVGSGRLETTTPSAAVTPEQNRKFVGGGRSESAATPTPEQKRGFIGGGRDGQIQAKAAAATPQNQPSVKKSPLEQKMSAQVSAQRSKQALNNYRAQQSKFKHTSSPVTSSPASRGAARRMVMANNYRYTTADYAYRRTTFYDYHHWSPRPWSYSLYPRFGSWDTVALLFWMDHLHDHQYRMAMYSHYNDPEMMAFRQQLQQQAATNSELRAKVATMDQEMASMRNQGVQADPNYVPVDMQQVAFSEDSLKETAQQNQQVQQPQVTPAAYQQPAIPQTEKKSHWLLWTLLVVGMAAGIAGIIWWKL